VFGGVISRRPCEHARGGDRKIVHNRPALWNQRQCGLRNEECAIKVCGHHIFPDRKREFIYRKIRVSDTGIVDQDVQSAKFASDRAAKIIHRVRVAHIARMGENSDFLTRQFPADPGQGLFIAAGQNEIAALSSQRACDGKTNPATGPGDESGLADESAHR
jgi:hypothetical protein